MVTKIESARSPIKELEQRKKRGGSVDRTVGTAWRHFRNTERGHELVRRGIGLILEKAPESYFEWFGEHNLQYVVDAAMAGHKIVLIANHQSHADAAPMIHTARTLNEKLLSGHFERLVYTMAGSMREGQGPNVALTFNYGVEPFFKKHGITPDYVVSNNDVKEGRVLVKPEDNGQLTQEAMLDPKALSMIHVEGMTKSGKRILPDREQIFGLQMMDESVRGLFANQLREGIPTLIVPVSIEGSRNIFDPDRRDFQFSGMMGLLDSIVANTKLVKSILNGEYGDFAKAGVVKIGRPKYLSELRQIGGIRNLQHEIMRMLAHGLSRFSQGEYGRRLISKQK